MASPPAIPLQNLTGVTVTKDDGPAMLVFPVGQYLEESKVVGKIIPQARNSTNGVSVPKDIIEERKPGYIVLVQGAMGSSHLRSLIAQCKNNGEDREYRELLQFHFRSSGVFATGKLPSRRVPFATVRFITLGSFVQQKEEEPVPINNAVRSKIAARLREHHADCLKGDRNGYECFRAINTHGRSFFTVEQQATFFTLDCTPSQPWSGVLLSDIGKQDSIPPWLTKRKNFEEARFLTVGSSDLKAARRPPTSHGAAGEQGSRLLPNPDPFTSRLKDDEIMHDISRVLCEKYPFVFVADLFDTSALCWDQALNFLNDALQHLPDDHVERVVILGEAKALIDRATRYFRETMQFIDTRARSHWRQPPRDDNPEGDQARVDGIASRLRTDFLALTDAAARLSTMCQETMSSTRDDVNIRAAQQALDETRPVILLTYLAFIFIPLALVSSIFGMNVDELDPGIPIKIPIFAGIGVLVPSLFVAVYLGSPR
ncbi:hypothetical protein QBC39DRAFT_279084, partial [Podospora conica]